MISFVKRVKPLFNVVEHALASEAFFCNSVQRTTFTKIFLVSYSKHKKNTAFIKYYHNSKNIPKDFGKVVELGTDFAELKTADEQSENKTKGNKSSSKTKSFRSTNVDEDEDEDEEEEEDEDEEEEKKILKLEEKAYFRGRMLYKEMDRNSSLLSSIVTKLRSRKLKERNMEILLEGKRLIYEAVVAGLTPIKIFFCRASDLEDLKLPKGTKVFRIPFKSCKIWCESESPQGVIGVFKMPDIHTVKASEDCLPLTVICNNVRDPGNLGCIIRIVAGVGCKKLILTPGCTGAWEQKVLRAAAGAHFHFPIFRSYHWKEIEDLISEDSKVFLLDGQKEDESQENKRKNSAFMKFPAASKELQVSSYYSVEFENENTVIVLGGETEGLSSEAYEFALKRNGTRVFIPMTDKIESLNNSVALGILAFEFKRQLHCIVEKEQSTPHKAVSENETSKV